MKNIEKTYDYEDRFSSYWYQIKEISNVVTDNSVLEIGPGNRFLKDYLTRREVVVETLDIAAETKPTYLGNVLSIPCPDKKFECVCAFEVLEHQPFELLAQSLTEMSRVSNKAVIFSVPDVRWFLSYDIKLFSSKQRFRRVFSFPRLFNRTLPHPKGAEDHYWEIGRSNVSVARILKEIGRLEMITCQRHYRVPSNALHHIFVLSKL